MNVSRNSPPAARTAPRRAEAPLDVARLFRGARLLVFGGTGFLGKVFLTLLLDRFPDIGHVHLVVRGSDEEPSEARFAKLVRENPCLAPLREQHADRLEAWLRARVTPIDGDVRRRLCGLDDALVEELRGSLDAIVNVAGVIDFHPPLDQGLETNTLGVLNLLELAMRIGPREDVAHRGSPACPIFHTSTCYVAGLRDGPIFEDHPLSQRFPLRERHRADAWDPARELEECASVIEFARARAWDPFRDDEFRTAATQNLERRGGVARGRSLETEVATVRTKWLNGELVRAGRERAERWGWPNAYTYTKSLGEQLLAASGLPFTIARPACCETTSEFPFPGWNEGISTSVPYIVLAMKGQTHLACGDTLLDLIPTDMVVSGMLLALGELLEGTAPPVYQLGASDVNPCSSGRFGELIGLYKRKRFQRRPGNPVTSFIHAHLEPAALHIDQIERFGAPMWARALSRAASAMKTAPGPLAAVARPVQKTLEKAARQQKRIGDLLRLFAPFSNRTHGPFDCSNTRAAYARLTPEWRTRLCWAPEEIDWAHWFVDVHMAGVEKWILPELED